VPERAVAEDDRDDRLGEDEEPEARRDRDERDRVLRAVVERAHIGEACARARAP
jgi:hypothetical protein